MGFGQAISGIGQDVSEFGSLQEKLRLQMEQMAELRRQKLLEDSRNAASDKRAQDEADRKASEADRETKFLGEVAKGNPAASPQGTEIDKSAPDSERPANTPFSREEVIHKALEKGVLSPEKYIEYTKSKDITFPADVQEYLFAKQQGFKGGMLDYKRALASAGRQPNSPQVITSSEGMFTLNGGKLVPLTDPATGKTLTGKKSASAGKTFQGESGLLYRFDDEGVAIPVVDSDGKHIKADPNGNKAPTESQTTAAIYGRRMQEATQDLDKLEASGYDRASASSSFGASVPNYIQSPEAQQQNQAERNFVNATLRRESGAAISPSEFESAEKQYFPRAGDSDEAKAQKKRNREIALESFKGLSGSAWRLAGGDVKPAQVGRFKVRVKGGG